MPISSPEYLPLQPTDTLCKSQASERRSTIVSPPQWSSASVHHRYDEQYGVRNASARLWLFE